MRILLLGGTAWLGRQVVGSALARGHDVTCLARGASGQVPDGAEVVVADRTLPGAYDEVAGREWDVVLDVSRQPGQVRSAVAALAPRTASWVFVSSGNAYADHRAPGQDERAPLLPPLEGDVMETMEVYGEAKVACEQAVLRGVGPDRALVARVGLIGGPGDVFDRSGWWPLRFARPAADDGAVLVPDDPDLLDVGRRRPRPRRLARRGGLPRAGRRPQRLRTRAAAGRAPRRPPGPWPGTPGRSCAAAPQWLLDHGVEPWMGERSLPLWLTDPDWRGFGARDSRRAVAEGLRTRPLAETLADVLAWELEREQPAVRRAGLRDDDERALLEGPPVALAQVRSVTSCQPSAGCDDGGPQVPL